MQEVGVMAVVEGLQAFLGDMGRVNSAINGLRPTGTMIGNMFEGLGNIVTSFGERVLSVAQTTLAILLRDAINLVIEKIRDLILSIIEAGSQFQILQLRLERLNFNTLIESGFEFNDALKESIRLTKEQLEWIQKLAATSPYDAQDVANVFTLARSYGFVSDEAKRLTENILDFAAGMGLGNTEIERIIINFGQLTQQGKLNGQELRDLARGAFVPVNDILERMAANMGITVDELNAMRESGEGGAEMVKEFMTAFNELVEERFVGASEKMSRTVQGAVANFLDLSKSILGLGIVVPIFDVIGGKVADFVEKFTGVESRWTALTETASRIGEIVRGILEDVIDRFIPDMDTLADSLVSGFQGLADWVQQHEGDIVDFFVGIGDSIRDDIIPFIRDQLLPAIAAFGAWIIEHKEEILGFFVGIGETIANSILPFIRDHLIPAFETIKQWVTDNGPLIEGFFFAIGQMVEKFFQDLSGTSGEPGKGGLASFLDSIKFFMAWVITHQDGIVKFAEILFKVVLVSQVLAFAWNLLVGVIGTIWSVLAPLVPIFFAILFVVGALIAGIIGAISSVGLVPALIAIGIGLAIGAIIANWDKIKQWFAQAWEDIVVAWEALPQFLEDIAKYVLGWYDEQQEKAKKSADEFRQKVYDALAGMWQDFVTWLGAIGTTIAEWATNTWNSIVTWVSNLWTSITTGIENIRVSVVKWAKNLWETIKEKFNTIVSDIKAIDWAGIGKAMIDGMVQGVKNSAHKIIDAAKRAAEDAYNAALEFLGIHSPSTVFMEIGEMTMAGMAKGIEGYAAKTSAAMTEALGAVVAGASAPPTPMVPQYLGSGGGGTTNNAYTKEFNLTVNTGANSEPILQDFEMLQSLAG